MTRRPAAPAVAGGRRGGRAAGLLPASLVTEAAARFPSRRGENSWRDLGGECLFSAREGDGVLKWYVVPGVAWRFPVSSLPEELR